MGLRVPLEQVPLPLQAQVRVPLAQVPLPSTPTVASILILESEVGVVFVPVGVVLAPYLSLQIGSGTCANSTHTS